MLALLSCAAATQVEAATAAGQCHTQAVDIGRHSNCPSDRWQDVIAPMIAAPVGAPTGEVVMINVGANKGFNLAEFLQRYSGSNLTNTRWHRLVRHCPVPAHAGFRADT